MKKKAIILFQKNLILGKVKTRLAAGVGEENALSIYTELVALTYQELPAEMADIFVYFSDVIPSYHPKKNHRLRIQVGKDLGERMKNALEEVIAAGYKQVVILGTDCPELKAHHLIQAFRQLEKVQVVLGPAEDGGYYLIGMSSSFPFLFEAISWSTDRVMTQTLELVHENKLTYYLLPTLYDVDTQQDWERFTQKFIKKG
jgi:rSAM/selenodomain-associated transferase 1